MEIITHHSIIFRTNVSPLKRKEQLCQGNNGTAASPKADVKQVEICYFLLAQFQTALLAPLPPPLSFLLATIAAVHRRVLCAPVGEASCLG